MKQKIKILSGFIILSFFFFTSFAYGEDLTITTYYPSPYGSYRELTWGCIAQGSVAKLKERGGGSIDLGGHNCADGTAGTASPELNFYNTYADPSNPRVQLRLNETATNVVEVNNGILRSGSGSIQGCTRHWFSQMSGPQPCPVGQWVAGVTDADFTGSGIGQSLQYIFYVWNCRGCIPEYYTISLPIDSGYFLCCGAEPPS